MARDRSGAEPPAVRPIAFVETELHQVRDALLSLEARAAEVAACFHPSPSSVYMDLHRPHAVHLRLWWAPARPKGSYVFHTRTVGEEDAPRFEVSGAEEFPAWAVRTLGLDAQNALVLGGMLYSAIDPFFALLPGKLESVVRAQHPLVALFAYTCAGRVDGEERAAYEALRHRWGAMGPAERLEQIGLLLTELLVAFREM